MGGIRSWIFRLLVIIGGGLLVYSWFQPWWTAYIVELEIIAVKIFPHAFQINMGDYEHWLAGAEQAMPAWFFTFMWVYFGAVIIALLFSLFASSKKGIDIGRFRISLPTALVTGVGLSYVGVVIAAIITIALKAGDFYDAPLQGSILVSMGESYESWVDTTLTSFYYLACGAAVFLTLLGVFRRYIVGKDS